MQQADPQAGGVDGSVVQRRYHHLPHSQRLSAHLVQDLARFGAGRLVDPVSLATAQGPESAFGRAAPAGQEQQRGPQRVAPEQREVPRAAGGQEVVVGPQRVGQEHVLEVV